MKSNIKTARIVGVLFILATLAPILSGVLFGTTLEAPIDLANVSANETQVMVGALFFFLGAVAVAAIAIAIYPVLRRHSEAWALGYVGARLVEGLMFVVNIIAILTLVTLSQESAQAGAADTAYYQALGGTFLAAGNWAYTIGFGLVFSLSALILNGLLYQTRLVPRWLSAWGFVGAVLVYVYYLMQFSGIEPLGILFLPIALQEMVFAIWLIVKGFNSPAVASESGKKDASQV